MWYLSSSLLIGANKILFDVLSIEVPLLVTFIHFSITSLVLAAIRSKRPDITGGVQVTVYEFLCSILPVALCTAGDVGLSNMAYSRVPVSVMTILKSSAPVCIYTVAVIVGVERFRLRTSFVCTMIAVSIAFAVPSANGLEEAPGTYIEGIVMVVVAVGCLSVRWVLVQSLLRKHAPLQLLYLIQPTSALILLPFALTIELNTSLGRAIEGDSLVTAGLLIFGSAFAAMALLFCEYKIVHDTTSLTLSVAGIGKEVLTLTLSAIFFSETFTLRQIVSISFSILGILLYALDRAPGQETAPVYVQTAEDAALSKRTEIEFTDLE